MMVKIDKILLEQIFEECRMKYPKEACGFVVGVEGIAHRVMIAKNIQDELHQEDPKRYPRDASKAYAIDPKEMEKVQLEAKKSGEKLLSIFHSHPEHDVYFSQEDKNMANPWGEPIFPQLSYLVVSVYDGEVKNISEFCWDKEKKDYLESKIL